jgi:hypothetical protein
LRRRRAGFNLASIENVKKRMTDDFTAKNVAVTEIGMLRRAARANSPDS